MSTLVDDFAGEKHTPFHLAAGAVVALGAHLAALLVALQCEAVLSPAALIITEIDLTPVELSHPVPTPTPVEQPAALEPRRAPKPVVQAARREPSAVPQPAAAGALLVAREDAPTSGEPVRFAVDATGAGYGFGVVAVGGGGGQRGGAGPAAALRGDPGSVSGSGESLRGFAVPPQLDEGDPCRGYFPSAASVDHGEVTLRVIVSNQGRVERATILAERPAGQSFGRSAVLCLRQKLFLPAQDARGRAQAAEAAISVRFSR